MARATPTDPDRAASRLEETLGASGSTQWVELRGPFNLDLSGAWTGSCQVERSFDGGATARLCTEGGAPMTFTGGASELLDAGPEPGTLYRVTATLTGGSLAVRLSQ